MSEAEEVVRLRLVERAARNLVDARNASKRASREFMNLRAENPTKALSDLRDTPEHAAMVAGWRLESDAFATLAGVVGLIADGGGK